MKAKLKAQLKDSIEYFLKFSDYEVLFPEIIIADKTDKKLRGMSLQFAINECFKLEDPTIIANEISFDRKDYEPVLCHELGHLISLSRNLRRPSYFFLKLLRDETFADREGFILYVRAGRNKWGYAVLFTLNFQDLLFEIKWERDAKNLYKRIKLLTINAVRLLVFIGDAIPKKRIGTKHANEVPLR